MKKIFKNFNIAAVLGALVLFSCEEVDETFDIEGNALDAYVQILTGDVGDTLSNAECDQRNVIIAISNTVYEDIIVDYDVVFAEGTVLGEDVVVLNEGFSGTSGSITLQYLPDETVTDRDTIKFDFIPDGINDGEKLVSVNITGARTASGQNVVIGAPGKNNEQTFAIEDVDFDIEPTGTFNASYTGAGFADGPETEVTITEVSAGVYRISDFLPGFFTIPIAYDLIRQECGWALEGPATAVNPAVEADVTGSFNAQGVLSLDVTLNNIVPGAVLNVRAVPVP